LKKNVYTDIIKTILESASEILKEWKIAITSVGQEYESTESQQDYKTGIDMTYRERGIPMDIGKTRENFDKDRKSKSTYIDI